MTVPPPPPPPPQPQDVPPPAPPPAGPPPRPADLTRTVVGLLLVAPAVVALAIGYAWPTIRTFVTSLQAVGFPDRDRTFVGFDNYQHIAQSPRPLGLGFALSFALIPLLILLVVAPLLAWAAHRAGRPTRLAARLALVVPMVCFAPTALALAARLDALGTDRLSHPDHVQAGLREAAGLTTFGLVCGIGLIVYLAALRGRAPGRSPWPAVLTVGGLAVLATVAIALQSFTYPFAITRGGPADASFTPMLVAYQTGLVQFDFGFGAAYAVLVLVPLMLLGIGAAVLVIVTSLRVEVDPSPRAADEPSGWPAARIAAVVGTVLGLVAVVVVALVGLWPWLSRLGGFGPIQASDAVEMLARTWLPPVVSTGFGVGLAALAGYGIGALRPLGRRSELLLLPFAPWLFVAIGPLFLTKYDSAAFGLFERANTVVGLIPPVWVVVPALFIFTLLFRGLESQRQAQLAATGRDPGPASMLLRALPMLALVAGATWLVQSQSLLWSFIVSRDPASPGWLLRVFDQFAVSSDEVGFGLVLPIPIIVIFAVALGLLQVFYLDRLAIRTGRGS